MRLDSLDAEYVTKYGHLRGAKILSYEPPKEPLAELGKRLPWIVSPTDRSEINGAAWENVFAEFKRRLNEDPATGEVKSEVMR